MPATPESEQAVSQVEQMVKEPYGQFFRDKPEEVPFQKEPGDVFVGVQREIISTFRKQSAMWTIAQTCAATFKKLIDAIGIALPFSFKPRMQSSPDDRILINVILQKVDNLPKGLRDKAQMLFNSMSLVNVSLDEAHRRLNEGQAVRFVFFEVFNSSAQEAVKRVEIYKTVIARKGLKKEKAEEYTRNVQEAEEVMRLLEEFGKTSVGHTQTFSRLNELAMKIMQSIVSKYSKALKDAKLHIRTELHRAGISTEVSAQGAAAVAEAPAAVALDQAFFEALDQYLTVLGEAMAEIDPAVTILWVRFEQTLEKVQKETESVTTALDRLATADLEGGGTE
jgi:hypothetical protein